MVGFQILYSSHTQNAIHEWIVHSLVYHVLQYACLPNVRVDQLDKSEPTCSSCDIEYLVFSGRPGSKSPIQILVRQRPIVLAISNSFPNRFDRFNSTPQTSDVGDSAWQLRDYGKMIKQVHWVNKPLSQHLQSKVNHSSSLSLSLSSSFFLLTPRWHYRVRD
jgi:hypothetical protein